jgi:hypothetical protein
MQSPSMLKGPKAPLPSPVASSQEKLIRQAYAAGLTSQDQQAQQLLELAGVAGPGALLLPEKPRGIKLVRDVIKLWSSVRGPYNSVKEAMQDKGSVVHGDNCGQWAWNQAGQGSKQWLHCNAHEDCQVQLRGCSTLEGVYLQVTDGVAHNPKTKGKRRKNSGLSYEQEASVVKSIDKCGAKPRKMLEAMTLEGLREPGPKKMPEGGLVGEMCHVLCCITPHYGPPPPPPPPPQYNLIWHNTA